MGEVGAPAPPRPERASAQAVEVGNGLLEDVAENVHVDEVADLGVVAGDFAGGPLGAVGKFLEVRAHVVGHAPGVEAAGVGKEAAVVGGDVQDRVARIDGAK